MICSERATLPPPPFYKDIIDLTNVSGGSEPPAKDKPLDEIILDFLIEEDGRVIL